MKGVHTESGGYMERAALEGSWGRKYKIFLKSICTVAWMGKVKRNMGQMQTTGASVNGASMLACTLGLRPCFHALCIEDCDTIIAISQICGT